MCWQDKTGNNGGSFRALETLPVCGRAQWEMAESFVPLLHGDVHRRVIIYLSVYLLSSLRNLIICEAFTKMGQVGWWIPKWSEKNWSGEGRSDPAVPVSLRTPRRCCPVLSRAIGWSRALTGLCRAEGGAGAGRGFWLLVRTSAFLGFGALLWGRLVGLAAWSIYCIIVASRDKLSSPFCVVSSQAEENFSFAISRFHFIKG